jgi:antitoxin MazE
MLIPLAAVGNSKGVRLPKNILKELEISDFLELSVERGAIVLRPPRSRKGWAEAFAAMHKRWEDNMLVPDIYTNAEFDGDWEW